jgi:hypothetical protein
MINHAVPVALPAPEMGSLAPNAKPGAPTQRPSVGPVFPLTAINVGSDELLGGDRQGNRPSLTDALANRVLAKGEPISAPGGRADDFSWPRTSGVNIDTSPLEKTPAAISVSAPAPEKQVAAPRQGAQTAGASAPVQRRPRSGDQFPLPFFFQNLFR